MRLTVKQVKEASGQSVRTLHHYDAIGLLRPDEISAAGYRLYSADDLERLQQIMFFKELGFSLADIKDILDSPGFDRRGAFLEHLELLRQKQHRLNGLIKLVEHNLEALDKGEKMTEDKMFDAFDEATMEEYKQEAKERWGNTDAYKESMRKTATYSKEDWTRIAAAETDRRERIAALMDKDPGDPAVQAIMEEFFKSICEHYYSCTPEIFKNLGEMYVADPRFAKNYETIKPGMADFMRQAMAIYADKK